MTTTKVNLANTVEGILPVANGGTGTSTGVAPGGSTTQVQYNNAGAFAGSANLVWDNTNARLGIGTTSPASQLEVKSAAFTDSIATINSTSTNVSQRLNFTANGTLQTQLYDDSAVTRLNAVTSKPLVFSTANTERMRIDSSGNVGIGTTATTTYRATIANNGGNQLRLYATDVASSTTNTIDFWYLDGGGSPYNNTSIRSLSTANAGNGNLAFYTTPTSGSLTERMRIDSSGRVGMGTTNPDARLQVQITQSSATTTDMGANSTLNLANSGTGNGVFNALKFAANQQDMFISSFNNNTQANRRLGFFVGSVAGTATTDEQVSIYGNGNFAFNSGYGSTAVAYGTRLWVNFNGSNGSVRGSAGISSVSRTGTGAYTVNYSITLPDTNYSATCGGGDFAGGDNICTGILSTGGMGTTSIQLVAGLTGGSGGRRDVGVVCLIVTR